MVVSGNTLWFKRSKSGTSIIDSTSLFSGTNSGLLFENPKTGVTKKLLGGMNICDSSPTMVTSLLLMLVSSSASRSAVWVIDISSGSCFPPGNAICPLWLPS